MLIISALVYCHHFLVPGLMFPCFSLASSSLFTLISSSLRPKNSKFKNKKPRQRGIEKESISHILALCSWIPLGEADVLD